MATRSKRTSDSIAVIGAFDEERCREFFDSFMEIMRTPPNDLMIYITSGGGSSSILSAMVDLIRFAQENGVTVTTVATGECMSSAAYLFLCGDVRLISPGCLFMIHKGKIETDAADHDSLLSMIAAINHQDEAVTRMICERSGVDQQLLMDMIRTNEDVYLKVEDVISHNFATGLFCAS